MVSSLAVATQEGTARREAVGRWLWALAFALSFGRGLFAQPDMLGTGDWDYFVSQAQAAYASVFEHGEFPLWSPYHCGGYALFENFQSRVYSPSFLLVLALGPNLGNRVVMLLWLALGFEGARRFARSLGASEWAARFAAFAFAGNGAVLAHMAVGHFGEMPYLAWPFWLMALREAEDRPARGALLGGLWLALSYVEAGIYPLVHGVLFALGWVLVRAVRMRSTKPLLALSRAGAASVALSAYVLVPSALHLVRNPRTFVSPETVPLHGLWTMLMSADLDLTRPFRFEGQRWGFHEYAAYVGPVFLLALALALGRAAREPRIAALLAAGVLFVLWVLGDFAPWSLHTLLHKLPVLSSMRASGRGILPALFCFAMAAALALDTLPHKERVALALTAALGASLLFVTPRALDKVFTLSLDAAKDQRFTQRADVRHFQLVATRNYSLMTSHVLRGRGALRCYEPTKFPKYARQRFPKGDEVWLDPALARDGVRTTAWSPQRLSYVLGDVPRETALRVNQNYHPGWVREDGGLVTSAEGTIATPVGPGTHEVTLRFEAPLFRALAALSLVSLLGLLLWLRREQESLRA